MHSREKQATAAGQYPDAAGENGGLGQDKPIILVGDRYFAEIAYEYFTHDSPYRVACFAVEREYLQRDELFGLPVVALEDIEDLYPPTTYHAFVALTYAQLNRVRRRIYEQMRARGYTLANYISSRAFVWKNVTMGDNVFIFEDNTVQPFVSLGSNLILWSGNHIGHHSRVNSHCFISSHVVISGLCSIGESCFMGVNSSVANNVTVGADNFIGFGVKVAKDTPDDTLLLPVVEVAREGSSARRFRKVV